MKARALILQLFRGFSLVAALAAGASAEPINFNRDIRPILSDRCFVCHGQSNTKRKADLRLDTLEGATGPLPKHHDRIAFVANKPEKSEAFRRIMSGDPDVRMPPPDSKLKLNDHEKGLIKQWIEQGAKWEKYWAFVKPVRPEAPAVKDAAWPRNDIDRFILAKLDQEGLTHSPEADKPTLIRRASLDLIGLPPTPAEVDAFVADNSPDAYEKVVDRLLASPHYGEQMAIQWLDGARYADSHGYQSDPERHMWRWRDWVINAYNSNMSFDEFTIEQIAGDLLPNATTDQKIATGFQRNHRINGEGGIIAEEWRIETVIDRADTTGQVFLGLTLGCCRCHDHKYDPFSQKQFYSLCAYYNNIDENGGNRDRENIDSGINARPILRLPSPEQQKRLDELTGGIATGEKKLQEIQASAIEAQKKWIDDGAKLPEPDGLVARFKLDGSVDGQDADGKPIAATFKGKGEAKFVDGKFGKAIEFDASGSAAIDAGDAVHFDRTDSFSYGAWVKLQGDSGTVLSKMDDGPTYRGFDIYVDGGRIFAHIINKWPDSTLKVGTKAQFPKNVWAHVMVTYDGSSKPAGVKIYFNGQLQSLETAVDTLRGDTIVAKAPLLIGRRINSSFLKGAVQDVRFYGKAIKPVEVAALGAHDQLDEILKTPREKWNDGQKKTLAGIFDGTLPELADARADLEKSKRELDELNKQIPDTMVMQDLPTPRDAFVLIRGQYDKHGEKVQPDVLENLLPLPKDAPPNRLALARWLVDKNNPLTARVQMNRLWERFFGIGIVKTSENMGQQGDYPSNPQLLDYLATEFMARNWDMKSIQKLIVTSAAYRQSSNLTPELIERDPDNRLLARGPRFRLQAEVIRDQALAVSGLLVEKIGEPSVRPYEPANLWDGNVYGNLSKYNQDKGEGLYRRSIYTFLKRTAVPANLSLFDMPTREYCVVKRSRTDTPLQALDLMNDPQYLEAARVLGQKMMTEGGATPAERIAYGFRRATCRPPSDVELSILNHGFEGYLQKYRNDKEAAKKLLSVGQSPCDGNADPAELAAYAMSASVILNLDEMVTKQ